jgi:hypothetical protein
MTKILPRSDFLNVKLWNFQVWFTTLLVNHFLCFSQFYQHSEKLHLFSSEDEFWFAVLNELREVHRLIFFLNQLGLNFSLNESFSCLCEFFWLVKESFFRIWYEAREVHHLRLFNISCLSWKYKKNYEVGSVSRIRRM